MQTSLEKRQDILRRVPYFGAVPADRIRVVAERAVERHYRAGEILFTKGHVVEGLYVVLEGRVTASVASEGREQTLRTAGRGRTFGDIGAFSQTPCPGVTRATRATSVMLIPRGELERLFVQHPHAALGALRSLGTRFRRFTGLVADLSLRPMGARIAGLLHTLTVGESAIADAAPSLLHRVTHAEVAAMVGSVRAVVQRELKGLERAGVIRLGRGRIQILDAATLAQRAFEGVSSGAAANV